MDIRVIDKQIHPLLARVLITNTEFSAPQREALAELHPTDNEGRLLAYSEEEIRGFRDALEALGLRYGVAPEDQPDPALLSSLQGRFQTRTEALAALEAGEVPPTLADLAARVSTLEAARPAAAPEPLSPE